MPITITTPTNPESIGNSGHTTDHNTIVTALTTLGSDIPYYNAKNYGAVGNGSTDDTAAIQAALNAVGAAGGGVVYLPSGTSCGAP